MMGIREGLMLRDYVDNNAQRMEAAKLQAQLYSAQAKQYESQNKLLEMDMQRRQALLNDPAFSGAGTGGQQGPQGLDLSEGQVSGGAPATPTAQPALPQSSPDAGMSSGERLLNERAGLYVKHGLAKEGSQLYQALLEMQKVRLSYRTQAIQDKIGQLYQEQQYPMSDEVRARNRIQLAAAQAELGKIKDAADTIEGKLNVVPPGAELTRTMPGAPSSEVLRTNPNRPIVVGEGGQAFQPPAAPGAAAVPITPAPRSPEARAEERGRGSRRGSLQAELEAPPSAEAGPPPGQIRFTGTLDGQPIIVDAWSEPHAQQILQSQLPGRQIVLTPQAASTGAAATVAGQREAERLRVQAGKPGATAADIAGQKQQALRAETQIPRETAEQIGVPVGTTYGQLPGFGSTAPVTPEEAIPRQLPSAKERDDLSDMDTTIQVSKDLLQQMQADPKAAGLLGSFLFNPKAALTRALARRGGKATPEEREFLAMLGVNAAVLRTKLIGLAQTNREMAGLMDFLPGPETSAEEIQASLQAIVRYTTVQREKKLEVQKGLGIRVPSAQRRDNAPATSSPEKPATTPATPAVEQKIQQMTPEQRLQRIHELEQKKQKAGQ